MVEIALNAEDVEFLSRLDFTDNRTSLLSVLAILHRFTDKRHLISTAQILEMLSQAHPKGKLPSFNTVAGYLTALSKVPVMGFEVEIKKGAGAHIVNNLLDEAALHHLINTIDTSRLLERESKDRIKAGLGALFSKHQQAHSISALHLIANDDETLGVMEHLSTIAEAMRELVKIRFIYGFRGLDGSLKPICNDTGEAIERIETPVNVFFARGYYYLETYPEGHPEDMDLPRIRLDRVIEMSKTAMLSDYLADPDHKRRTVVDQMRRETEALGGDNRTCFVRVKAIRTNQIFDQYGPVPFVEDISDATDASLIFDSSSKRFIARLDVSASNTFYRWLAGFQGDIEIFDPLKLNNDQFQALKHEGLHDFETQSYYSEDYEALKEGYLNFLGNAAKVVPDDLEN